MRWPLIRRRATDNLCQRKAILYGGLPTVSPPIRLGGSITYFLGWSPTAHKAPPQLIHELIFTVLPTMLINLGELKNVLK